ncbi:hypothetical protein Pla163_33250 [Planctomycetes bacterium Pla163]|uniref:Thioredoxin domain-containing protein n=1 Tax=Rohdeia mirabilis TaxID=2528008 RepID=A0A518D3X3_9BACT|nr:hypothetical protein Pla163_33250 [Planctomycetes bacterium Pla163]
MERRLLAGLVAAPFSLLLAAPTTTADVRTASALVVAFGFASDEGQGTAEPGTRIEGLLPGTHVFGVSFDPAAVIGSVVVVEIGGSCAGCRAFTPPLLDLAEELEGRPFHLVASHNQDGDVDEVRHEIFQNGLGLAPANVSVVKGASHPGVTDTGHAPYYMVFDQHGALVHHHLGGPYHGGDGLAVLERVREMLRHVPAVYTGSEPFDEYAKLAERIASGVKLERSMADLEDALADAPDDPELVRLAAAVERHVARRTDAAEALLARDPKEGFDQLDDLVESTAGTRWHQRTQPLAERFAERDTRKNAEKAAKALNAQLKAWNKLEPVAGNGGDVLDPFDPTFRAQNAAALAKIGAGLREIVTDYGSAPAAEHAARLAGLIAP